MTACAAAITLFHKEILQKTMDFEIEDNRYKTILPRKHDLFKASLKKIEREKKNERNKIIS